MYPAFIKWAKPSKILDCQSPIVLVHYTAHFLRLTTAGIVFIFVLLMEPDLEKLNGSHLRSLSFK